jgi:glycerophosphoryl diester phosphodiesterase
MPLIDLNGLGYFKDKENGMIAADYSASKTYAVGEYVYYNGTLYRCTTAITTAEAWTSGHWTAAKLAEDVNDVKSAVSLLDVTDKLTLNPQYRYLNYSNSVGQSANPSLTNGNDKTRCTNNPIVYVCNREFTIVNDNSNCSIVVVKISSDWKIVANTGWLTDKTIRIKPSECAFFSLIFKTKNGTNISSFSDFFQNIKIYVSKIKGENEDLPIIIGYGGIAHVKTNGSYYQADYLQYSTGEIRATLSYLIKDKDGFVITVPNGFKTGCVIIDGFNTNFKNNIPLNNYGVLSAPLYDNYGLVILARTDNTRITSSDMVSLAKNLKIERGLIQTNRWFEMGEDKPIIYAHRMDELIAPPNTLSACKVAKIRGYKWVECDVQLTSDNVPVLFHDDTINSVSTGTGAISSHTLAELQSYDFYTAFNKGTLYNGTKILTLADLIHFAKANKLCLNIEPKTIVGWDATKFKILHDLLKYNDMLDKCMFNSNTLADLAVVHEYDGSLELQYLVSSITEAEITNALTLKGENNKVHICVSYANIDAEDNADAIDAGLVVDSYDFSETSDVITKTVFDDMISKGVNGIISSLANTSYYSKIACE